MDAEPVADCAYEGPERRETWPTQLDIAFWRRLYSHMGGEDEKFRGFQKEFEEGSERMAAIERDLQPIKKMYWAIVGSAGVGTLLLGLLTYVYISDKSDFKDVQRAIVIQGEAIQKLMISQSNLEQSYHRDVERIERGQDRLLNQQDRKGDRDQK